MNTDNRLDQEEIKRAKECLDFIGKSVSCFHAVENAEEMLRKKKFTELQEKEKWELEPGKNYYVKRNGSSVIAFKVPEKEVKGFHIMASHSDSPTFKVKAEAEITVEDSYKKLDVEPYGGMIHATWLDRCLSVAGRIVYLEGKQLVSKNINIDEDLLIIPNVAIHMNREMNKNLSYNPQIDLQPLFFAGHTERKEKSGEGSLFMKKVAEYAGIREEQILGRDLFLYVREQGKLAGPGKELVVSPRLDDLECVYASLKGFLKAEPVEYVNVCAVFDNEEVGSLTKQGAASTFLSDTLKRTGEALFKADSEYLQLLADSFMISADNAHALHPNHPEKADPLNRPCLNQGIVIKYHGGQKYTTDAWSEAVMKSICKDAEVPFQSYCNRSDIAGGSTLGNISAGQVSVPCVDIGLPQLAMHSAVETAGTRDISYLIKAAKVFYSR
ncbi:MAG: M18 family aminopeptidase [Suilimivivens sp.]